MLKRIVSTLATLAVCFGLAVPVHAQQPVQWRYSFDTNGVATATYPGNTTVNGSQSQTKTTNSAAEVAPLEQITQTINGVATLGQPTSGYNFALLAADNYSTTVNYSGWNQSTNSNSGRTGVANYVSMAENRGNGDHIGYYANCQIFFPAGKAGATHWLAQPACVIAGGNVASLVAHTYLQGEEYNFNDNGTDVAAIGYVNNFIRTNNAATFGEVWMGSRWQSTGTKAINVGYSGSGLINVGLDLVNATADATWNGGVTIPVNMRANQKIVLNSTSTPINGVDFFGNTIGNSYLWYNGGSNSVQLCNGSSCLGISSGGDTFLPQAVKLNPRTFASLTAATTCNAGNEGFLAAVTDSNTAVFNAAIAGGGANRVMAYCNGTAWTVH